MKKYLLVLIAAAAVALALTACSSEQEASEPAGGADEPEASEQADGGATAEETGQQAEEAEQPAEPFVSDKLPTEGVIQDVPELKFSVDATSVTENDTGLIIIDYENMPQEEYEAYVESLKDAGFTYGVSKTTADDYLSYSAQNGESQAGTITVNTSWSSDGSAKITFMDFRNW